MIQVCWVPIEFSSFHTLAMYLIFPLCNNRNISSKKQMHVTRIERQRFGEDPFFTRNATKSVEWGFCQKLEQFTPEISGQAERGIAGFNEATEP